MQVQLKILRYDPERDQKPHWERYTVETDPTAPLGDLLAAKAEVVAFAANAALIRREDQMLGSLLDRQA